MKTTELQDRLHDTLSSLHFGTAVTFAGKWWGRGEEAERYYFGRSTTLTAKGKPVRGIKVWLQFDDPSTLEGASLRVEAPKTWYKNMLAKWHMPAFLAAIELVDPADAAKLRAEIEQAEADGQPVTDMVAGEDD